MLKMTPQPARCAVVLAGTPIARGDDDAWPFERAHNPHRKDGRAHPGEGRIVIVLPFNAKVRTQAVVVEVTR